MRYREKKLMSVIVLILVLIVCPIGQYDTYAAEDKQVYSAEEIYENLSKAMVEIKTWDSEDKLYIGSGFFVAKNLVMTNYHVVSSASKIAIIDYSDRLHSIKSVYAIDEANDLVIFKVDQSYGGYFEFADDIHTGEPVYAIGSPIGLTGTFINGMVSRISTTIDGVAYVQLCMPSGTGLGGGPIINKYGEVLGVMTLTVTQSQNISLAVNYVTCKCFLEEAKEAVHLELEDFYKQNAGKTKESNYYVISDTYDIENTADMYADGHTEYTSEQIYDIIYPAMVDITSYITVYGTDLTRSTGSGFFVADDMIVTNSHVVAGYSRYEISDYLGNDYRVTDIINASDVQADVAFVKVQRIERVADPSDENGEKRAHTYLTINNDYLPKVGETIYAMGSPRGMSQTFSNGMVSMTSRWIEGYEFINMTASITPGSSGGPLVNKYGDVIGINTLTVTGQENLNFALQAHYIVRAE